MTEEEIQEIVDLVLQALATNSKTIEQLTNTLSAGDSDYFELSGGRKISFTKLAELVNAAAIVQETGQAVDKVISQKVVSDKLTEIENKEVEQNRVISGLRDQVENYKPIVIEGNVTNAADEEDLHADSETGLIGFANRSSLYGMGYVILRKDKTFAEQVIQTNTIYEIKYDFSVDAANTYIPNKTKFIFNGGNLTIYNGKLNISEKTDVSFVAKHGEKIIAGQNIPNDTDGIICFDNSNEIVIEGITFEYNEVNLSFLLLNNSSNILVNNCHFGGLTTQDGKARKCIYSIGCDNMKVTNNTFKNVRGAVTFGNTLGVNSNCIFCGNIVSGTHLSGINCFVKNAIFSSNTFENVGISAIAICGDLPSGVYSENVSVVGNTFRNLNTGIQSDCTRGGSIHNISIVGNTAISCDRPFYLASAADYVVMTGNIAKGSTVIGCDATRLCDSLIFNNVFEGSGENANYGIRLTVVNEYSDNTSNVKIFGNYIKGFRNGIYLGEFESLHCNDIDIDTNKIYECTRGCVATPTTTNLTVRRNTFVGNVTDVDIRCEQFDFEGNVFSTTSAQTHLDFILDTSSDRPVITKETTYEVSVDARYVLRNFTDNSGTIKRVSLKILSENIIIGQGSGIYNLYGASYSPLIGSTLTFEKRGTAWYEIPTSPWGIIPSVSGDNMPPAAYRKGMILFDNTSGKVAVSNGSRWQYLQFET